MDFSLGLVEVSALGNAIMMLDEMLKVADVEFTSVERKLGGRLVTIVVRGSISSVTASVEAGKRFAESAGCLKAAEVIARPHPEILKFLNLEEKPVTKEPGKTETLPAKPEIKAESAPAAKKTTKNATAKTTESKPQKASEIKKAPKSAPKKTKQLNRAKAQKVEVF